MQFDEQRFALPIRRQAQYHAFRAALDDPIDRQDFFDVDSPARKKIVVAQRPADDDDLVLLQKMMKFLEKSKKKTIIKLKTLSIY